MIVFVWLYLRWGCFAGVMAVEDKSSQIYMTCDVVFALKHHSQALGQMQGRHRD